MKNTILATIVFVLAISSSIISQQVSSGKPTNPAWVDSLIVKGTVEHRLIRDIKSYTYKDKLVYLFNYDAPCCDHYVAVLKDDQGVTICHPFGGISGKGDMQCLDFYGERANEIHIWHNENPILELPRKAKSFKIEKPSN